MARSGPRIALVHALPESPAPALAAFERLWPEAATFNLMDDSLAPDLAARGQLDAHIHDRFMALGRYAAGTSQAGAPTRAILFTCSAFGDAIDAVRRALPLPVLRPNEACFEDALRAAAATPGGPARIGLVVTFRPSLAALEAELRAMAAAAGQAVEVAGVVAEGALAALKAGDGALHDRLVLDAARSLDGCDRVVLGQFSMARARLAAEVPLSDRLLTTPDSAVLKLRALLA